MKAKRFFIALCLTGIWLCSFIEPLNASSCVRENIPCDDGSCVDRRRWCDKHSDCPDGSDEKYCQEKSWTSFTSDPNGCKETHFLCQNGICFPLMAKCDGMTDCKDGFDEKECEATTSDFHRNTWRYTAIPPTVEETDPFSVPDRISEPQPSLEVDQPYTTPHSGYDSVSRFEPRRTSLEERQRYPYHQPPTQDTGVAPEPAPERQPLHHRPSPRSESRTLETVHGTPRPAIRRPPPRTRVRTRPTDQALRDAEEWLLRQRDSNFGWGTDTSRAVVALSLSQQGRFFHEQGDTYGMKKKLQVLLEMDLIRNNAIVISLSRLSLYINGLLATCQNPRDFRGRDLASELRKRTTERNMERMQGKNVFINPLLYLTLCLVNETAEEDLYFVREMLYPSTKEQKLLDMQSISIMAYSCISRIPLYTTKCEQALDDAVSFLMSRIGDDGNFGNVYSSALATQALLAANSITNRWDPKLSIEFLKTNQKDDGSFGDLVATYHVLPVLAGKSLADLKGVICNRTRADEGLTIESMRNNRKPLHFVRYSLYYGDPVQVISSKTLGVPINSTFFDIMKLAAEMDLKFRFQHEQEGREVMVYAISNIPNDAKRGIYWQLYLDPSNQAINNENGVHVSSLQPYDRGVQHLIPSSGSHVVFWYRPKLK